MQRVLQVVAFVACFAVASSVSNGVIGLDKYTFDKIVGKERPVLVRFDQDYSYGDENDAFEYAAKNATSSEVLVASVGISEWGEKENQDLADRFGVKKEDWPMYIFFPKGSKEGVTFSGNKKDTYAILQFIRKQGVWVGLPGCNEKLDELASQFMSSKDKRADIIKQAEKFLADIKDDRERTAAKFYIAAMRKIEEKGDSFVETETQRLKSMLDKATLKKNKKDEFQTRLNVLSSFSL
uniref:Endoplasmic reticulum resident protein 29 C-terminal domain-containing protein n=1 Tax=Hanusia phi TaxID=3032 RepID=A0A7S0H6R2_9CRYP|mmetsp:Transcript_1286/g.2793  ORF Transcript_1286/g.2793 Transcript_1286/m.2793 type:complete len:238 (+) Transcript_1286:1-714(+)